jgi:hypothetical protein
MSSDQLNRRLRLQRCRNQRPAIVQGLSNLLGMEVSLDQFIPLEESDALRTEIGAQLRATDAICEVTWPGAAREDVAAYLRFLARESQHSEFIVFQSYSEDLGALSFSGERIIESALVLTRLQEEDAILATRDGDHGLMLEHEARDEWGNPYEHFSLKLWGSFKRDWEKIN